MPRTPRSSGGDTHTHAHVHPCTCIPHMHMHPSHAHAHPSHAHASLICTCIPRSAGGDTRDLPALTYVRETARTTLKLILRHRTSAFACPQLPPPSAATSDEHPAAPPSASTPLASTLATPSMPPARSRVGERGGHSTEAGSTGEGSTGEGHEGVAIVPRVAAEVGAEPLDR